MRIIIESDQFGAQAGASTNDVRITGVTPPARNGGQAAVRTAAGSRGVRLSGVTARTAGARDAGNAPGPAILRTVAHAHDGGAVQRKPEPRETQKRN
jgi:hypothetical protein